MTKKELISKLLENESIGPKEREFLIKLAEDEGVTLEESEMMLEYAEILGWILSQLPIKVGLMVLGYVNTVTKDNLEVQKVEEVKQESVKP